MKFSFILFTYLFFFVSCAQTQSTSFKVSGTTNQKPTANEAIATFSEGCFWHAEIVFQSLVGVRDAVSGYAGGSTSDPDYEKVSTGSTGHAETVQVYYDPSKITYETLVKAYFASENPTQENGQGNDLGTEYRSIIFYRDASEKAVINAEIKKLDDTKKYNGNIVVQVVPFTKFYKAEDYHQEYIANHPDNPYVRNVSIPEFMEFKRTFKGDFK